MLAHRWYKHTSQLYFIIFRAGWQQHTQNFPKGGFFMGKRTNTAVWSDSQKRWQIKVQKDGVRKTFTSYTKGRTGQREANAKADAWLDHNIENINVRCDELLDEWLISVQTTTSISNYRKHESHVKCYIRPAIGHIKISSLTNHHLQQIIDQAFRNTNHKNDDAHELSRKTLMNIRASISAFLKYCRRRNLTTLSAELLEIPKAARYKTKTVLQPSSLKVLFNVDTTIYRGKRIFDPYIYAYRFAVLTGVRPGELRGLEKAEVFQESVRLTKSINYHNEITQGKNANAVRTVVLSPIAKQVLNAQLAADPGGKYVFPIVDTRDFRRCWQRYCVSNDIEVTSLYELRHTFVSIAKTLPEGMVKSIVGHSAQMDTFGVYGHTLTTDLTETSSALQARFEYLLGAPETEVGTEVGTEQEK